MRGRQDQAARPQVFRHAFLEQRDAGGVEIRDRLVEDPQRSSRQQDAADRYAPLLPCRQSARRQVSALSDLQSRERGAKLLLQHWASQGDAVLQVFERGEVRLERIDMSEVRELLVILVATLVQLPAAPDDLAGLRRQQPCHATQEARLADAVRPDDLQQLTALQLERRAA